MPGLEKLKKFSEDISQIGAERTIRQENGTIMPATPIPDDIPEADDAYDFEFELPTEENLAKPKLVEAEDTISSDDIISSMSNQASVEPAVEEKTDSAIDFSDDLLAGIDLGGLQENTSAEESSIGALDDLGLDSFDLPNEPATLSSDIPDIDSLFFDEETPAEMTNTLSELDNVFNFDSLSESTSEEDSFDTTSFSDNFDSMSDDASATDTDIPAELNLDSAFDSFDDDSSLNSEASANSESSDALLDDFFSIDDAIVSDIAFAGGDTDNVDFAKDPGSDFDDSEFEIPGFSDSSAEDTPKSPLLAKKKADSQNGDRKHLTDKEYELFKQNLQLYPLNLRLAIDEAIVKDEFTDEAIMDVLFKVVKKVSARKLATHLEKMLDTSINVPLNYERRTAEQYNEYKLSIQYQLKNRIIPGAIVGLILATIMYILFYLGNTYIYKPMKAESLYKEGYALIENNLFVQSEIKFNEALSYKQKKKWFFSYAQGYQDKKQYERARNMYEQLILRYNYAKRAGIVYAQMEYYDLANYEKAAHIASRYVLDHHINDKEAMLLLGDIYLDWASSLPEGKEREDIFEKARLEYANLMHLYGQTDVYLSRMLRYFMRTDNLKEVLPLKTHFFSSKKVSLENNDLIELGGYLLEKRYGYLSASDEYLRGYITELRDVLQLGVERAPDVPEAHYNYGRYFTETSDREQAIVAFNLAIQNFEAVKKQSHERTLKHVDSHRLLGSLYIDNKEYISAEEILSDGIRLFEHAEKTTGLIGDERVGMLFSEMGDLNYFIAGNLDVALDNYIEAIDNKYDTASIRYKIGYIQYDNENFSEALNSFIKTAKDDSSDRNLLLSLGNVLFIRGNNSAATAQYKTLMDILVADRDRNEILLPQVRVDHAEYVDLYLKTSNNLGAALTRLARTTGNTSLETEAFVAFSESLRAWDSLTRNQETMIRLQGTNLAEQNVKYLVSPMGDYEPAIYASIPRTLFGEEMLTQSSIK